MRMVSVRGSMQSRRIARRVVYISARVSRLQYKYSLVCSWRATVYVRVRVNGVTRVRAQRRWAISACIYLTLCIYTYIDTLCEHVSRCFARAGISNAARM